MEILNKIKISLAQVHFAINDLSEYYQKKIPEHIKVFFEKYMSKDDLTFKTANNKNVPIYNSFTTTLFSLLAKDYLCANDEERQLFINKIKSTVENNNNLSEENLINEFLSHNQGGISKEDLLGLKQDDIKLYKSYIKLNENTKQGNLDGFATTTFDSVFERLKNLFEGEQNNE